MLDPQQGSSNGNGGRQGGTLQGYQPGGVDVGESCSDLLMMGDPCHRHPPVGRGKEQDAGSGSPHFFLPVSPAQSGGKWGGKRACIA